MKVSKKLSGLPFNFYRFGEEPEVELGRKDSERFVGFEAKFEELNTCYMKLLELGLAPRYWEFLGGMTDSYGCPIDLLLPAWKRLLELVDENWSLSDQGDSWYNVKDESQITNGTLRFSDNWNFYANGKINCKTTETIIKETWALGRYENGMFEIVEVL